MGIRIWTLGGLVVLAGCASPSERCIDAAMADLRGTRAEIARIEAALARGYYAGPLRAGLGVNLCTGSGNVRACLGGSAPVYEQRRPVDATAERAKLAQLRNLEERQAAEAARAMRTCGG